MITEGNIQIATFKSGIYQGKSAGRWHYVSAVGYEVDKSKYADLTWRMEQSDYRIKVPFKHVNGDEWLNFTDEEGNPMMGRRLYIKSAGVPESVARAFHEKYGAQPQVQLIGVYNDDGQPCGMGSYADQCFYFFPNHYNYNDMTTRDRECTVYVMNGENIDYREGFVLKAQGYNTSSWNNAVWTVRIENSNGSQIYYEMTSGNEITRKDIPSDISSIRCYAYANAQVTRVWDDGFREPLGQSAQTAVSSLTIVDVLKTYDASKDGEFTWFSSIDNISANVGGTIRFGLSALFGGQPYNKEVSLYHLATNEGIKNLSLSCDKIPASGGTVSTCMATYRFNGVEKSATVSFASVTAGHLHTTLKPNEEEVATRTITITEIAGGRTYAESAILHIYQRENVVTNNNYKPYNYAADVAFTKDGGNPEMSASGGENLVTITNVRHYAYNLYSSGDADTSAHVVNDAVGSINMSIASGSSSNFYFSSTTPNLLLHQQMQGNKSGTTETDEITINLYHKNYSSTIAVNSISKSITNSVTNGNGQGESETVQAATQLTRTEWGTPTIYLSYGTLGAAKVSNLSPSLSVYQHWDVYTYGVYATIRTKYVWASGVTTYSDNRGGGSYSSVTDSGNKWETNYTVNKWAISSSHGVTINTSTGAISCNSLGTTATSAVSSAATITVSITSNGQSGSHTCTVGRSANEITSYSDLSGTLSLAVGDIAASGGSKSASDVTATKTCSQTITYTSGDTRSGSISYSGISGNTVSAGSLGTTTKSRWCVKQNAFSITATGEGGKTKSASVSVYQAKNELLTSYNDVTSGYYATVSPAVGTELNANGHDIAVNIYRTRYKTEDWDSGRYTYNLSDVAYTSGSVYFTADNAQGQTGATYINGAYRMTVPQNPTTGATRKVYVHWGVDAQYYGDWTFTQALRKAETPLTYSISNHVVSVKNNTTNDVVLKLYVYPTISTNPANGTELTTMTIAGGKTSTYTIRNYVGYYVRLYDVNKKVYYDVGYND